MKYFLQLNERYNGVHLNFRWEQVDEFIYNNWKKCLRIEELASGDVESPRYSGNRLKVHTEGEFKDQIEFDLVTPVTHLSLGNVCRFLGIEIPQGKDADGYCRKPEFIPFRDRGKDKVHKVGGKTYK